MTIPFNRPTVSGNELEFIADAVARAKLSGDGFYTYACQDQILALTGGKRCLLVHSCTAALEMAALLLDLKPGDEVILPSFTFVSTANAVALRGATCVFVDIRPDTMNLDPQRVADAITERTRAVFAVHYAGVPADIDPIRGAIGRRNIAVVEDAAQALGSQYRGRPAGSLGDMSAFSFHETKNLISGEGGALVLNNPDLIVRAEIIREKGTNRSAFFRGEADKYTWQDIGSSYLPSELVAAFLHGQLLSAERLQRERMGLWNAYYEALAEMQDFGFRLPIIPDDCVHNAHMFALVAPTADIRDGLIQGLKRDGITAPFHYVPLHSSPAGLKYGRVSGSLEHTDVISSRLLRLPMYPGLESDQQRVVERVLFHARALASSSEASSRS